MFNIAEELKKLPKDPGVYIMRDAKDNILYVGKAVNLSNRVKQYFQVRERTPKIAKMISQIDHFEYIVVDSEMEALILECNLIKEYLPKYNTMLKDGKNYPYIKVTTGEEYPRLFMVRERKKDKARYFGPYTSGESVRDTIDLLSKTYGIRKCNRVLPRDIGKEKPCLYYHIGQCQGPCTGKVTEEKYKENVDLAIDFLAGKKESLIRSLKSKMAEASENMEFEKAAAYRDMLISLERMNEQQKANESEIIDRDIVAIAVNEKKAVCEVMFIRGGKLLGREHFYLTNTEDESKASLETEFIKQFYLGTPFIPSEIIVSEEIEDSELLAELLSSKAERKVNIIKPQKGKKERLVLLAEKNAQVTLERDYERVKREEAKTVGAMQELGEMLGIPSCVRVESYDISNMNGFDNVGSMVVFENGKKKNSDYRKFKIKTVTGQDDYGSLHEVLTRRFAHGDDFTRLPDLILMDGGLGQVNQALLVMEETGIHVPVCGMVKDDHHRTRALLYNGEELPIDTHSEVFKLITRIQDETHRFAIEYHRSLRLKGQVHSVLDDIPGIGEKRRRALMQSFGSIEEIRDASVERLMEVPLITEEVAGNIYAFFNSQK